MNERPFLMHERTLDAGRAARVERFLQRHGVLFAILLFSALFLAFAGAFGTGRAPAGALVTYWLGVMLTGGIIALGVFEIVERTDFAADRPWGQAVAIILAISVPQTLAVCALATLILRRRFDAAGIVSVFPTVVAVCAAVAILYVLAHRTPVTTRSADSGAGPPPLLDRLSPRLQGAELYAVQAEGHYVRLHTERGSELLLMRLGEAMRELDGLEGAQTHRSWWVSKAAVTDARRGGGRATLALKGGIEAPVSRSYARSLRRSGWF